MVFVKKKNKPMPSNLQGINASEVEARISNVQVPSSLCFWTQSGRAAQGDQRVAFSDYVWLGALEKPGFPRAVCVTARASCREEGHLSRKNTPPSLCSPCAAMIRAEGDEVYDMTVLAEQMAHWQAAPVRL